MVYIVSRFSRPKLHKNWRILMLILRSLRKKLMIWWNGLRILIFSRMLKIGISCRHRRAVLSLYLSLLTLIILFCEHLPTAWSIDVDVSIYMSPYLHLPIYIFVYIFVLFSYCYLLSGLYYLTWWHIIYLYNHQLKMQKYTRFSPQLTKHLKYYFQPVSCYKI